MSYAFNATANALGANQDDAQQQANVFTPNQAPTGGAGGAQRSDTVQASDAGGDLSGGSQPSGAAATAQAPASGSTAAQNRVFQGNQGKVKAPVDANAISGQIDTARGSLQKEADSYVSGAGGQYTTPSAQYGAVDDYVNKGTEPTGATNWKSDYQRGNGGQVDAFAPKTDTRSFFTDANDTDPQTNTPIPQMLSTDAGIQQLMRRNNDAEYNQNDAALDTALLRKDQTFNQTRDRLLNNANDLKTYKDSKILQSPIDAQKARDAAYTGWQGDIKNHLQGDSDAITADAQAKSDAFNTQMAALQSGKGGRLDMEKAALQEMGKNPAYSDLSSRFQLPAGDVNQYFDNSANPTATTANDFYSQDQVGQFGRVGALLGAGGPTPATAGQYFGKSAADVYKDNFKGKADFQNAVLAKAKAQADREAAVSAKGGGLAGDVRPDLAATAAAAAKVRADQTGAMQNAAQQAGQVSSGAMNNPYVPIPTTTGIPGAIDTITDIGKNKKKPSVTVGGKSYHF